VAPWVGSGNRVRSARGFDREGSRPATTAAFPSTSAPAPASP